MATLLRNWTGRRHGTAPASGSLRSNPSRSSLGLTGNYACGGGLYWTAGDAGTEGFLNYWDREPALVGVANGGQRAAGMVILG